MKKIIFLLVLFPILAFSQNQSPNIHIKKFKIENKQVVIDSVSITPFNFKVFSINNEEIPSEFYSVDFGNATLYFKNENVEKEIIIQYQSFPSFLTQTYHGLKKSIIVENPTDERTLYSLKTASNSTTSLEALKDLNASGSITRGFTVGNNQNGVSNSNLNLQLSGKLSQNIRLEASIIDTNLPIQENGNTYRLNEFDRVFIKLTGNKWQLNGGNIFITNFDTSFLRFTKDVAGVHISTLPNKIGGIEFEASGALVRGKYKRVQFTALDGIQGPYRLADSNDASYFLILSGTEQIYVNGRLLKRGIENDYVIDYNNAEVTFNATFPITANMRISAEFLFTNRTYSRFITYEKVGFSSKKFSVKGYFYNENDLKNQPLDQNLDDSQKEILSNAGDDLTKMTIPSAYIDTYSEDKILYEKIFVNGEEVFAFSTNENIELFNVTFTFVGENNGNYRVKDVISTGKIFEFVGQNQGNYNPIKQLAAPEKLQIIALQANFSTDKTTINTETAVSNYDQNLFSGIDSNNDIGIASKINFTQVLTTKKWKTTAQTLFTYIENTYQPVERIQEIEFSRNWNSTSFGGTQKLLTSSISISKDSISAIYEFENLLLGNDFKGLKHAIKGKGTFKNFTFNTNASYLLNSSNSVSGDFFRYSISLLHRKKNKWLGLKLNGEANDQDNKQTNTKSLVSQKFDEIESFAGIGDSTNVFVKVGFTNRVTDSVVANKLTKVNNASTFYLKSTILKNTQSQLSAYINYRILTNEFIENQKMLNSQLIFNQYVLKRLVFVNTTYQTFSGALPQQDFNYIKTAPGQGYYSWIDYNENGIKELDEFEIAQFTDQAEYLRIILPTVNYIPIHKNKLQQTVNISFEQWQKNNGFSKFISHFSNQTLFSIENSLRRKKSDFNLNPFDLSNSNLLGLNYYVKNSLYFNRGVKTISSSYHFTENKQQNITTIDNASSFNTSHQLDFLQNIGKLYTMNLFLNSSKTKASSLNFTSRNYYLLSNSIQPEVIYNFNTKSSVSIFYQFENSKNQIGLEKLKKHQLGTKLNLTADTKMNMQAEINYYKNEFTGSQNSPVAFQMMEGLNAGNNLTWSLFAYKKLSSVLNLNISYWGRKNELSKAVHTGTIQLRAQF